MVYLGTVVSSVRPFLFPPDHPLSHLAGIAFLVVHFIVPAASHAVHLESAVSAGTELTRTSACQPPTHCCTGHFCFSCNYSSSSVQILTSMLRLRSRTSELFIL